MILKNEKKLLQKDFRNEKELQTYFEKNMDKILGCKFIETEFSVGDFRIDSLAFDPETNSFKIIEYKNVKNHSLVDQGYTYLKLMLERKADFILKYNEVTNSQKRIDDIEWEASRIVFVSPVFTPYQTNASDFKNIPIDLVKITRYEDDIVDIDFIKKTSSVNIQSIQTDSKINEVNNEIKVYTEEDHLNGKSEIVKNTYETLKSKILELDDIDVDVKKVYIAFKGKRNIVDIELFQRKITVFINLKKDQVKDEFNILSDISGIGHHGNGDYCMDIFKEEDIDKIMPFIRQSLKINKK